MEFAEMTRSSTQPILVKNATRVVRATLLGRPRRLEHFATPALRRVYVQHKIRAMERACVLTNTSPMLLNADLPLLLVTYLSFALPCLTFALPTRTFLKGRFVETPREFATYPSTATTPDNALRIPLLCRGLCAKPLGEFAKPRRRATAF